MLKSCHCPPTPLNSVSRKCVLASGSVVSELARVWAMWLCCSPGRPPLPWSLTGRRTPVQTSLYTGLALCRALPHTFAGSVARHPLRRPGGCWPERGGCLPRVLQGTDGFPVLLEQTAPWWLKAAHIYYLTAPKVRSLKWVLQAKIKGLGKTAFLCGRSRGESCLVFFTF